MRALDGEEVQRALELLGVGAAPTLRELRRGFARQCRLFHPDRYAQADDAVREKASERMRLAIDAYRVARRGVGATREASLAETRLLPRPPAVVTSTRRTPYEEVNRPTPLLGWVFDAVA